MLNRSTEALAQWKGASGELDRWLDERHDLIVMLCEFADHQIFDVPDDELREKVQRFRSLLIDYVSAGHFEIYQRLVQEPPKNLNGTALEEAEKLFEEIDNSTSMALAFNDKYENPGTFDGFGADLSALGESMESRFAAEDKMIGVLHSLHTGAE